MPQAQRHLKVRQKFICSLIPTHDPYYTRGIFFWYKISPSVTSAAPSPAYQSPAGFLSLSLGLGHAGLLSQPLTTAFAVLFWFLCVFKRNFATAVLGQKIRFLLKYTLVSSHGSAVDGRSTAHVLLLATGKNSTEMSVWALWKHLRRSRSTEHSSPARCPACQALLTRWTTAASPGRKNSQCIRHAGLDWPPSSAGFSVKQLSSHSCGLMSKVTVAVCWRNIWGLLECVSAWFWILLCISVLPVSGFNAVEQVRDFRGYGL